MSSGISLLKIIMRWQWQCKTRNNHTLPQYFWYFTLIVKPTTASHAEEVAKDNSLEDFNPAQKTAECCVNQ
jgi:hypothetical protein